MNTKTILLTLFLLAVFVVGCTQSNSGYPTYNQQAGGQAPQGQQGQYVGGGCGVSPSADYETPVDALGSGAAL